MKSIKLLVKVKGGPGSGNWGHTGRPGLVGGSGGSGGYRKATTSAEWRELEARNAPPPESMYRWANLTEIHDMFLDKRTRSLDVSEDDEFYFAPPSVLNSDSFVDNTYGRFVLDAEVLRQAGWKRDPGLFGEQAWRMYDNPRVGDDQYVIDAYRNAIRGFEVMKNPHGLDFDHIDNWMSYRLGKSIPITKHRFYTEEII